MGTYARSRDSIDCGEDHPMHSVCPANHEVTVEYHRSSERYRICVDGEADVYMSRPLFESLFMCMTEVLING